MIQFERILCPLDLTPTSGEALRYAIALAKSYEAKLYLCHCVESPMPVNSSYHEELCKEMKNLASAQCGLFKPDTIRCETIVIEGQPAEAIARLAAEHCVDLLVMASRRRPLTAALLGSTAEALCRTAPCPVLVVHPHEREWVGKTNPEIDLHRILIAYDFSTDAELALNYGSLLAQEYQAELHLLHVLPFARVPALATMTMGETAAFHVAARRLHQTVPAEAFLWCEIKQAVRSGQPYHEILAYAEEHKIDLICLGVHGAGFAMRALFGSNTDRVLRQAPCPVLITRPLKPSFTKPAIDEQKRHESLVSC